MVLAHGLGGAADLPLPLPLAIAGAVAALAVSFIVLALAWRSPRYDAATQGRPVPAGVARVLDGRPFEAVLRTLGLVFFLYVAWAAVAGPDLLVNPTFGVVYVLLWVGIVPASLLFGPFYKAVNPLRTLHLLVSKVTGGSPEQGLRPLPSWLGLWPAAFMLLSFVWLELVYPENTYLSPVRLWFALYLAVVLVGAAVFGSEWIARTDPFEAYSTLVGHLSVWGRRADGVLVVRSPLANLDGVPVVPGLTAVVGVLLGSTAFDSFRDSNVWLRFLQSSDVSPELWNTLMLVVFCAGVVLTFGAATMLTGVHEGHDRWRLPDQFAPSVVPIIVGYIVAHYVNFFYEKGQQTLVQLSDPMATGADYLGTADWQTSFWLSANPDVLAWIKVLAVVTGHVLGVVAAHDRAVKLLPRRHQLTGQLPLLVVMVFYTVGGLYLLLSV